MLDLGKPYALRALQIATPTKGFSVELYGAVDAKELPEDILDKRWEHLTDVKKVVSGKVVSLLKKSDGQAAAAAHLDHGARRADRPARGDQAT